jgi:hypothetical protein
MSFAFGAGTLIILLFAFRPAVLLFHRLLQKIGLIFEEEIGKFFGRLGKCKRAVLPTAQKA